MSNCKVITISSQKGGAGKTTRFVGILRGSLVFRAVRWNIGQFVGFATGGKILACEHGNREGSFFCSAVKETFLATRSTRQSRFED